MPTLISIIITLATAIPCSAAEYHQSGAVFAYGTTTVEVRGWINLDSDDRGWCASERQPVIRQIYAEHKWVTIIDCIGDGGEPVKKPEPDSASCDQEPISEIHFHKGHWQIRVSCPEVDQ